MKQLGTLPKEEKPAAGKLINAAKVGLEAALRFAPRTTRTQRRPAQGADRFHPARPPPRPRQTASPHPGDRRHRPRVPQDRLCRGRRPGNRGRISLLRRPQHARRPSRARFAGHVLFGQPSRAVRHPTALAPHPYLFGPNPRDGKAAAARAHHRAGPRLSPRQRRRHP